MGRKSAFPKLHNQTGIKSLNFGPVKLLGIIFPAKKGVQFAVVGQSKLQACPLGVTTERLCGSKNSDTPHMAIYDFESVPETLTSAAQSKALKAAHESWLEFPFCSSTKIS